MRASLTKNRDMARSILPSKNRRPARVAKAKIKRAHRSAVRQSLRGARGLADLDEWDLDEDLVRDTSIEMRQEVRWRRSGDKLRHFERWAVRVTRNLRPQDRLSSMAARLPRGLIGDHALSHLQWLPELNPDPYGYHRYRRETWERRRREQRAAVLSEQRQLERAIRLMLETPGGHKGLNAAMKEIAQLHDHPPYLLRDVHGVEAFVAGLYPPPRRPRCWGAPPPLEDRYRTAVHALADAVDPAWRSRPG